MKSPFKIEKGVPPPVRTGRISWPFGEMEVGDSFSLEPLEYLRIASAASYYGSRHNMKFSVRKDGGEYRCWRVA